MFPVLLGPQTHALLLYNHCNKICCTICGLALAASCTPRGCAVLGTTVQLTCATASNSVYILERRRHAHSAHQPHSAGDVRAPCRAVACALQTAPQYACACSAPNPTRPLSTLQQDAPTPKHLKPLVRTSPSRAKPEPTQKWPVPHITPEAAQKQRALPSMPPRPARHAKVPQHNKLGMQRTRHTQQQKGTGYLHAQGTSLEPCPS